MDTRLQNLSKTPSVSSVSPGPSGLFQQRPFSEPDQEAAESLQLSAKTPDLQTQLDRAARFGHNFSRVQVQANTPAVIQPSPLSEQFQEQQDEREANSVAEPVKMMAPPLGNPIQRESLDAEPIQMMLHPSLLTSLVQRESLEAQPIEMMPQLGLRSPVIQPEVEEVEPIQMMPQLGLYSPVIQPEVEEVEPIQMMPQWGVIQRQEQEVEQEPIQTKLVVGAAGDKYEQEADSMAAQVMSMSVPPANAGLVQRQGEEEQQEPLVQRSPLADSITPLVQLQELETTVQPKCSQCEQEEQVQTKASEQRSNQASSNIESQLSSSKGGGSPLPDNVRSFMEPRFGTDFSSVRVHTDSTAVQMNKELGAQAFTHGSDIYFGAGKSPAVSDLTAHELTHVVQQTGAVKLKPNVGQQGNPSQPEAHQAAVSGRTQDLSIQPLCDKCQQEQQEEAEDKAEETLQAKELPGHTHKVAPDIENQKHQLSQQLKEAYSAQSFADKASHSYNSSGSPTAVAEQLPHPNAGTTAKTISIHGEHARDHQQEHAKAHPHVREAGKEAPEPSKSKPGQSVTEVQSHSQSQVKAKSEGAGAAHSGDSKPQQAAMKADLSKVQLPKSAKLEGGTKGETKAKGGAEAHKEHTAGMEKAAPKATAEHTNPQAHDLTVAHHSQKIATEKAAAKGAAHKASTDLEATHAEVAKLGSEPVSFAPPHRKEASDTPGKPFIARKAESTQAVERQAEQQHTNAGAIATNFLSHNAAQLQKMAAIGQTVPPHIHQASSTAQATINATVAQERSAIVAHISQMQAQAQGKAAAARAQITGQHQAAVSAIRAGTKTARQQIDKGYQTALQSLNQRETAQHAKIDQLYAQGDKELRATGPKVGNEAIAIGQRWHDNYLSQCTGKDDNILDGPLTDNRLKARANTAIQVAQEYQKKLIEKANEQADKAQSGKSKDQTTVHNTAENSRKTLEAQHKAALEGLTHAEQHALSSADQTQSHLLTTISQQLTATLHSLEQQQSQALQHLNQYGQSQHQNIERQAHNAIASLQKVVKNTTSKLQGALHAFRAKAKGMPAPDVNMLQATLKESQGHLDHAVATVQAKVQEQTTAAAQGIIKGSQQSVPACHQIGQGAIHGASAAGEGFTKTVSGLTQSAHNTFTQLQQTHVKTVTTSAKTAVDGFQKVMTDIDTQFNKIDKQLELGFNTNVNGLETGLRGAVKGLEADIQKYGDKAASEVQPRWKSVLKIVLLVVVVLVVAFVIGPLLVGLGPIAAIAAGALVGAASSAVIQMGNNLIDGKNLMDGVGKAALIGALGGALGAAGGLVGASLANSAGKLVSAGLAQSLLKGGITVGMDAGANVAGSIAGDLLEGKPITLEGVLYSAIQGAAFAIGMGLFNKIKVKVEEPAVKPQEPTVKVDEPTVKVNDPAVKPQEPTVKVNEPTVKPNEPTVKTTDTPKGRSTHMDEPEVEPGVVAKEPTADGREIKVTKEGEVLRCTGECKVVENSEVEKIPDSKRKAEQAAEVVEQGGNKKPRLDDEVGTVKSEEPTVKAEAPVSTTTNDQVGPSGKRWDDPTMTESEFIGDYKNRYPKSNLSDADLKQRYQDGQRLNPETGRLAEPIRPIEPTGTRQNLPTEGEAFEAWQAYLKGDRSKPPCFPAGTLVKTPEGDKAIENLAPGEFVFAYDFDENCVVERPITAVHKNWTQFIVVIETEQGKLSSTRSHPYWVESESKWLRAVDIQKGMMLRLINSDLLTVHSVETYAAEEDTYNFEVEQLHNYFVNSSGVLVHNGDGDGNTSGFEKTETFATDIYEIRDVNTGEVIYVGKTIQGVDARFDHHLIDPKSALYDYINNPNSKGYIPPNDPLRTAPNFPKNLIDTVLQSTSVRDSQKSGGWTRYETAVWEQYYIDKHGGVGGGKLINRINAITPEKFVLYSQGHNPCM